MKYILILITFFTIFTHASDRRINGKWYSGNTQGIYQFYFYKNGTYSVTANSKKLKGKWNTSKNSVLYTRINGMQTNYYYKFNKGFLVLQQSQNNFMMLGRNKSYFKKPLTKNSRKNRSRTKNRKGVLSNKEFLYLLENFTRMNPDNVYNSLTRFNKEQKSWTSLYSEWFTMTVFRACQGKKAYKKASDRQLCNRAKASYNQSIQTDRYLGTTSDPWMQGKRETGQLIMEYKRKLGKISNRTYQNTMKIQSNYNKTMNNISQSILKSMESPRCTDHYEEGTNAYLGCY